MSTNPVNVGKQLKLAGMGYAAAKRNADLQEARTYLVKLAQSRQDRMVSADDAAHFKLGNAAGSLFKSEEWSWRGFAYSKNPSSHARVIRTWILK